MAAKSEALLKEYRKKRDFAKTAEPSGEKAKASASGKPIFIVQKHDATRLHYDFRLELDGVLLSWAVTKGPSLNSADKRLAVHVEDHPLDYADFEGTIPKGEYGGGTVMLWDQGTWEPEGDPHAMLKKGDLKFTLHGKRLKGSWVIVHMKGRDTARRSGPARENWLLIKHRDGEAKTDVDITEKFTTSVTTGRDLDGIAKGLKSKKRTAKALEVPAANVWTRSGAVALPKFQQPQLATLADVVPSGDNWIFELKYDGYRALAAIAGPEARIYTRTGKDWTDTFHRLRDPLAQITKGSALLDGEICAFDDNGKTDFGTLQEALGTGGPLAYFVFDLLEQDGEDLRGLPLVERKARLQKLLAKLPRDVPIQYSDHIVGNGKKVFDAVSEAGQEGIIAKDGRSKYIGDRSKTWLKIKAIKRQEFVIGGWRPSDKRNHFASLLVGSWDGKKLIYHGRVGTGFNEQNGADLQKRLDALSRDTSPFAEVPRDIANRARWVEPKLVAEIAYAEFTSDSILRHPSFIALRADKPSKSVKLEVAKSVEEDEEPAKPAKPAKAKAAPAKPKAASPTASKGAHVDPKDGVAIAAEHGVKLSSPDRVVYPDDGVTKADLVAYYAKVADKMLEYVGDRPLSLVRAPGGIKGQHFFQKHDTGGFPSGFKKVVIPFTDADDDKYLYVEDAAGLIGGVQMNALEWHIWGSRRDMVEKAERVIFDIDPDEGLEFRHVKQAAKDIRDILGALGLEAFAMATGGKGIHVICPIGRRTEWPETKAFCRGFSKTLEKHEPDRFVAELSKAKRKGRMFVDYLRNQRGQTAVGPYSTRARAGCPVAVPISWDELEKLDRANGFTLETAAKRAMDKKHNPWPGYFDVKQPITQAMLKAVGATED